MEQNSPLTITVSRKRGGSTEKREEKPEKVRRTETKRHKEKKRRQKDRGWSVSVTEIPEKKEVKEEHVTQDDEEDDGAAEPGSPDDTQTTSPSTVHHSPIAAFLPPQQALWTWADPGWRQSSKSRRLMHARITKRQRGGEEAMEVRVGDCAVFLSTSRPDRPYIGRIHSLWQTAGGNMKVDTLTFNRK